MSNRAPGCLVAEPDKGAKGLSDSNDIVKGSLDTQIVCMNIGDEAPVPDDGIKPTFTERPVIRQSDDGNTITFECRLVGDPKPSVKW